MFSFKPPKAPNSKTSSSKAPLEIEMKVFNAYPGLRSLFKENAIQQPAPKEAHPMVERATEAELEAYYERMEKAHVLSTQLQRKGELRFHQQTLPPLSISFWSKNPNAFSSPEFLGVLADMQAEQDAWTKDFITLQQHQENSYEEVKIWVDYLRQKIQRTLWLTLELTQIFQMIEAFETLMQRNKIKEANYASVLKGVLDIKKDYEYALPCCLEPLDEDDYNPEQYADDGIDITGLHLNREIIEQRHYAQQFASSTQMLSSGFSSKSRPFINIFRTLLISHAEVTSKQGDVVLNYFDKLSKFIKTAGEKVYGHYIPQDETPEAFFLAHFHNASTSHYATSIYARTFPR